MQPEDRLDTLLAVLRERAADAAGVSSGMNRPQSSAEVELAPLLRAAREVAVLRDASPDPIRARDARERMLARAAALREHDAARGAASTPVPLPTHNRSRAPLWAGLAAAALVAVSAGTFTAAAHAGPASPLFGLHRLEQSVQVATASDNVTRARLHIQYARQWLAALSQAASQHQGSAAFQSALAAMLQENAAAQGDAAQVADSAARADLRSALDALMSDERAGLHSALGQVRWTDRVSATTALGQLGETIPSVAQVQISAQQDGIQVSVSGSGFEPGAQLIINGRPTGQVVSRTPTLLVVAISREHYPEGVTTMGISNPDGTAAQATQSGLDNLFSASRDASETSGGDKGQVTPSPNSNGDHGGTPTPGGHQDGGGEGTPTPQATRTPDH